MSGGTVFFSSRNGMVRDQTSAIICSNHRAIVLHLHLQHVVRSYYSVGVHSPVPVFTSWTLEFAAEVSRRCLLCSRYPAISQPADVWVSSVSLTTNRSTDSGDMKQLYCCGCVLATTLVLTLWLYPRGLIIDCRCLGLGVTSSFWRKSQK